MTIGATIRAARKAKKWTLERLAHEAGTDTGNLSRLERDLQGANKDLLERILHVLGISLTGSALPDSNAGEALHIKGQVPLISWVQAGYWSEVTDIYAAGNAERWLPCPAAHGPRTFALQVPGSSMHNPSERHSFHDGDIIFVDPGREATHNSLIVAKLPGSPEATFKRLLIEGSQRFLMALNPSWPERIFAIDGTAEICGVAIAKYEALI
ncbi:LexA family protein [Pseudomonas sp. UBA7530]|uniref:LexA family protein n=1 Tax=Pseudomonas sp. UBA7530 TaxID=1947341 RepID=UPI0015C7F7BA|nr:XRE family transcriptional regulator [Pseudomonas sp. UBA7530]